MNLLAIESSAVTSGVALLQDGRLLAQSMSDCGLTHSKTLMPQVEQLLATCALTPSDLSLIAVPHGPGSFTGVRIGVSCAAGLAFAAGIPALGVSTLEAMAYGASYRDGLVCPVMDARRNEVYTALFRIENGAVTRLTDDCAIPITLLAERLAAYDAPAYLVGDGAHLAHEQIPNTRLAPVHVRKQRADGVALCALARFGEAVNAKDLAPVYLRLSQAEREKLAREAAQADEPSENSCKKELFI